MANSARVQQAKGTRRSLVGGKLGTLGQHRLLHGFSPLCVTSEIMCVQEGCAGIDLAGA